jgi:hypothetical protein
VSESVLGPHPIAGGDDEVLHPAPTDAEVSDDLGGHGEQGVPDQSRPRIGGRLLGPPAARGALQQREERTEEFGLEPAHALRTDTGLPGEIDDGSSEPGGIVLLHEGGREESQEGVDGRGGIVRGSEWHRCSVSPGLS